MAAAQASIAVPTTGKLPSPIDGKKLPQGQKINGSKPANSIDHLYFLR